MNFDSYTTAGGPAGTTAVLADLEQAAQVLRAASWLLHRSGEDVMRQERRLQSQRHMVTLPVERAAHDAELSLAWVLDARSGIPAVRDDIEDLEVRLQATAAAYLEAEINALRQVSAVEAGATALKDAGDAGWWLFRFGLSVAWKLSGGLVTGDMGDVIEQWLMPDSPPPTTGLVNRATTEGALGFLDSGACLMPVAPVPAMTCAPTWPFGSSYDLALDQVALAVLTLDALFRSEHRQGVYRQVGVAPMDPPAGLQDLMGGVERVHDGHHGAVGIQTLIQEDGTKAHVVYVPGTQDWLLGSGNSFNGPANLPIMQEEVGESMRMTVATMEAAGIDPDAPVMIVGHSQGGIAATSLAGMGAFNSRFNVTHVVTAGSPTGFFARSDGIQYAHLEHLEDLTPGLDGARNPDQVNVTTASRRLRDSSDPELAHAARNLVGAHSLIGYADTARLIDENPSASFGAFFDSAAPYFEGAQSVNYAEFLPALDDPLGTIHGTPG